MDESATARDPDGRSGGSYDLAAWQRAMTPRERLYLAFKLSRSGASLVRKGQRARLRGN